MLLLPLSFFLLLVAIPQLPSKTWKQSSSVKYAVMIVVGSQGVLYPFVLYLYFCAVIILITIFRCRWPIIASTTVLPKPIYCFLREATVSLSTA